MARAISISSARQGFFDIFASVVKYFGKKVVIESRTTEGRAVLVGEQYLQHLEDAEQQLRRLEALGMLPAPTYEFKMIGSMASVPSVPQALSDIRSDAKRRFDDKLDSL